MSNNKIILLDNYYCSFNKVEKYKEQEGHFKVVLQYLYNQLSSQIIEYCKLDKNLKPDIFIPDIINVNSVFVSIYNGLINNWKYFNQIETNVVFTLNNNSIIPSITDIFGIEKIELNEPTLLLKKLYNLNKQPELDYWI